MINLYIFIVSFVFIFVKSEIIKNVDDELWNYTNNDTNIIALLNENTANIHIHILKTKPTVNFRLYSNAETDSFEQLYINDILTLQRSQFNYSKPTKFITHGWKSSPDSSSCILIKDAFMQVGDYNVIVIDWSSVSNLLYIISQSYVREVALEVALMIDFLVSYGMKLEETTLIGHSLGAHVMGIAGYNIKQQVNHIIGLDPAGPFFLDKGPGERISSADATYVEILHTNAGLLGLKDTVGHRDFFPNGGRLQKGCNFPYSTICSHTRSYEIYAESILEENKFYGRKCDTYINYIKNQCLDAVAIVGDLQFETVRQSGSFYFKTNAKSPYSMGICGVQFGDTKCEQIVRNNVILH